MLLEKRTRQRRVQRVAIASELLSATGDGDAPPSAMSDATASTAELRLQLDLVAAVARLSDGRIETIGGTVTFGRGVLSGMQLDVHVHSGDIDLSVPAARSPALDLSSRAGATMLSALRQSPVN